MKVIARILRFSVYLGVCFIAGVVLLYNFPQILINQTTLKWVISRGLGAQVKLDWQAADLRFKSDHIFHKSLTFSFQKVCIQIPESKFEGCSDHVAGQVGVEFRFFGLQLVELTPLEVRNFRWELGEKKSRILGVVEIKGTAERRWTATLKGSALFSDRSKLVLNGQFELRRLSWLRPGLGYQISVHYLQNPGTTLRRTGTNLSELPQVNSRIRGELNRNLWKGSLDFSVEKLVPGLPTIYGQRCQYQLRRQVTRELWRFRSSGSLHLECLVGLGVSPLPQDVYRQIPRKLPARLQLDLSTSDFIPRYMTELVGEARLSLNPIRSSVIEGGGQLRVALTRGVIGKPLAEWRVTSTTDLRLEVPEFRRWVENFKETSWAVPAPFHVLHGSVEIQVQGEINWKLGRFPFRLKTHLHSSSQVVKLVGKGFLLVNHPLRGIQWRLHCDAALSDAQLVLPQLNWSRPPRLVPDSRFYSQWPPDRVERQSNFHFRLTLRTEVGRPLYLLTNLATQRVPVLFEVHLSDELPPSGYVRFAPFPVEVFRRKAQIEWIQLTLREPLSSSLVFGRIQTQYADYKITVQLGATLERPHVHLVSEPALPENQILSVLLFGQPLEQLAAPESASVGSLQAAIADQALGLASLWALASTPVQSLSYNSQTGVLSAKLKLAEGTSLSLGASAKESAVVEFQQRLGSNLTIQAGVERSDTSGKSASASLQWSRRY